MADYQERVGTIAKAAAGFGMDGGRASIEYQMPWAEVEDFCRAAIGSVQAGKGKLSRVLPLAHPQFPWLFVERVATIEGFQFDSVDMQINALEAPAIEYYAKYNFARVVLEFAPRPYSLFADTSIGSDTITYHDRSGVETEAFVSYEYWRFTSHQTKPAMEYLTAQHGQFRMAGTGTPAVSYPGQIRLIKRSKALTITWHHVPFVVSEGDNIFDGLGHVNQFKFWGYAPGTLLFTSYSTTTPVPEPFPELVIDEDLGTSVPSTQKVCNIEFSFLYVEPETGSAVTPPNKNHIAYGHNVFPWFRDGLYYYSTTGNENPLLGTPPFPSYPFELLFTPSPDA